MSGSGAFKTKYTVFKDQGKGMFSSVLRVRDADRGNKDYVVKIIRNNETTYKAGLEEIQHLKLLNSKDPKKQTNIIWLEDHFDFRNHLMMIFEPMKCNLRQLIKKVGAGSGFNINTVQLYSSQLFKALAHLKHCRIIHADIKPDNVLVSEDLKRVKLCDFGASLKPDEVEIGDFRGSRFYRSPEQMVGLMYSYPIDMFAMACVLAETFSGRFLFKGDDHNQMLLKHQKLVGAYPVKIGRKGFYWKDHFNEQGVFMEAKEDTVTGMTVKRKHSTFPKVDIGLVLDPKANSRKVDNKFTHFKDLLGKMLHLDPSKRMIPEQGVVHPFNMKSKRKKKAKGQAPNLNSVK